jgi:hypothetical protein
VLSTVGLKRAPSLRVASPLRRPFEGRKDAMRAAGDRTGVRTGARAGVRISSQNP